MAQREYPDVNWAAVVQAGYYIASGVWPIIHISSFERITGPKLDKWLVKTVGILVTVIGATLAAATFRKSVTPEIRAL